MVLSDVCVGENVKLIGIDTSPEMQSRLMSMGLFPGIRLVVDSNVPGRPLILRLDDSRLTLCPNLASRIRVSAGPNGSEAPLSTNPPEDSCHPDCPPLHDNPAPCLFSGEPSRRCRHMPLRYMAVNQRGIIRRVVAQGELGRRIREMGLVPNTEITVVGRAPLKDPVALRLRDFTLSLRNNEADFITVEVPDPDPEQPAPCDDGGFPGWCRKAFFGHRDGGHGGHRGHCRRG